VGCDVGGEAVIEPGQTCPTCNRRVSHPRKHNSPDTVVFSYRVPVDEAEAHKVVRDEAAKFLATAGRPHDVFWTLTFAFAAVLQDESLKGVGQRSEVVA
jgi:hypothetical protein